MVLAALYPVIVWLFVFRYRRTLLGLLLAVGAVIAAWLLADLMVYFAGGNNGQLLRLLIRAETVLLAVISLWLWSMKRRPLYVHCDSCWYDLRGHTSASVVQCPECGTVQPRVSTPRHAVQQPADEHQPGQNANKQNAKPTEFAG